MSIWLSFCKIRTQRRKEKRSLCSSNRERQTLLYKLKVKYSLIFLILCSKSSVWMEWSKNQKV